MVERMKDLEKKEVIDIKTGSRLGFICDLEIAMHDGRIVSIVVPRRAGFMSLSRDEMVIPWRNIRKIGEDIVIVDTGHHHHGQPGHRC